MSKTYRIENEKIIKGVSIPIFIHNLYYHLSDLHIYEDGMIDCWDLVDFDGFKVKVKEGWIKTTIPEGETILAFPLGTIHSSRFITDRNEDDLIKEVKSIIDAFQGRKTTEEECMEAFEIFKRNKTLKNRQNLKLKYELVAGHKRKYLLRNMQVDDIPIRAVIYGSVAFKESDKAMLQEKMIREVYLKGIDIS